MQLTGLWHIYKMELWDENYLNMEVQAYVEVDDTGCGRFQFGLVNGDMDGTIIKGENTERIEFSWAGSDECDEAFGRGWLALQDNDNVEGVIAFHFGDESLFWAKRA